MKRAWTIWGGVGLFVVWLAGCVPSPTAVAAVVLPSPTGNLSPTVFLSPTTVVPTWTPSLTVTAAPPTWTPVPTATSAWTPTVTWGWRYWPNAVDFRAVVADRDGSLWLGALSGLVHYRPADGQWRVWTVVDGLPDTTVESVVLWHAEVWVGTQGGVGRFDPQTGTWRSYSRRNGLPGGQNIHLYLDEQADVLWAATSEGLARYLPDVDRWQSERGGAVQQVWADADALWIDVLPSSGQRGGLYRLDKKSGRWQDIHLLPDTPPVDAYALTGNEHTMWAVGARGRVYACDLATLAWREVSGLGNRIDTFFQHPIYHDGRLWLLSNARIVSVEIETGQVSRIPYPQQPYFYPQYHPVWVGQTMWLAAQSGLYALEAGEWNRHARANPPAQITALPGNDADRLGLITADGPGFFQPHDGIWTAMRPDGANSLDWSMAGHGAAGTCWVWDACSGTLTHYDGLTWGEPLTVPAGLAPLRLLPRIASDGQLWFVGHEHLIAFNPSDGVWRMVNLPNAAPIEAVAQTDESIWLIRGGNALVRFDIRHRAFDVFPIPYGGAWRQLAVAAQSIWLGGEPGRLLAFEPSKRRWQELSLACPSGVLYALAADEETVWGGGEAGAWQLERASGVQICLTVEMGMLDNRVEQIALTDDGWVWFFNRWRGLWGYGPLKEVDR